jgi:hypothetical protein
VEPLTEELAPFVPQFRCAFHDFSALSNEEIKGEVLTRLVLLAMRHIFSNQPEARLEALLRLIDQVQDRKTALEILELVLRYYVQGTQRIDEQTAKALLQNLPVGDEIMQTWIEIYSVDIT